MKGAKPILWIVVGLLIGASGTSVAKVVPPQQARVDRLAIRAVYGGAQGDGFRSSAYFLRDSKTAACWLVLQQNNDPASLAPAPREACE